jgi:hypothetical protein
MDAKELGKQPAGAQLGFLHPDHGVVSIGSWVNGCEGLSKREYFASLAGPVPDWFPAPQHNRKGHELRRPKPPEGLSADESRELNSWNRDPCWDLPEGKLAKYQKEIEIWREFLDDMILADHRDRISAWAAFYADALLVELAKEA